MQPPKSWKEFDLPDRAARRAAGLENADVVQQTLIHINEINDFDEQPIPIEEWNKQGAQPPPVIEAH
jgi:hypothetical protein